MKKIPVIAGILVVLDQIIKDLVVSKLAFTESVNIINNFFRITYMQNTGGAWSILAGNTIILAILSIIILIFIIYVISKDKKINNPKIISYGLLIGGIIGNLIDRLWLNYVIDYLDFNFGGYYFPVFNLADIAIVIGGIILILVLIKEGD